MNNNDNINAWKPYSESQELSKENENIVDVLIKIAEDCGFKLDPDKTGFYDGRLRIVHAGPYTIEQRSEFFQKAIQLALFELESNL